MTPSAESPRAAPFFPDDANICPLIACHSLSRMSLPQPSQGTLWALLFSFFLLRLHQVPLWRNWFSYFSSTAASFITNLKTGALLSPGNGQLSEDRHKVLST